MAIDTRNKRASVQAYTFGLQRPKPDGTINAADRATSGWHYSGITYAPPTPGGTAFPLNGFICNVGRMMGRR